ncbi:gamma-interferon-inducible protein 16 [Carlito syrichta]|uniref:Gamma-interferon-inducible protein 16 n=1 Tax=Carlito syrichta TaxID=1868482 RepID=A0A3Q0EAW6_CARSF|nr:gamma-interferon-inducible protein 16 [Carlito syrichta]
MANKCKIIVLTKGLEEMNDYYFKMVKSLLAKDLKLTRKMQEEYDRIKIADLMEEKFHSDAGLGKLIKVCQEIAKLQVIAETLKKEKSKAKGTTPSKKRKLGEVGSATPEPTTSHTFKSEGVERTPGAQKRKNTTKEKAGTKRSKVPQEQTQLPSTAGTSMSRAMGHAPPPQISSSAPPSTPSEQTQKSLAKHQVNARRHILQQDPMIVMVLNATKLFEYEASENERKQMFHATVATKTQLFHVKVLNIKLKRQFTQKRILIISNYFEHGNLLEVNEDTYVSEAGSDQKIEVPNNIIKREKETSKIDVLHKQASGTIVYGLFTLLEKTVNKKDTIYGIQDATGNMDVVGRGTCHNIPCEVGDQLQLFCFRLQKKNQMSKLISEMHSFIEVKKKANQRNYNLMGRGLYQEQGHLPAHSEASTALTGNYPQTAQKLPLTLSKGFFPQVQFPESHSWVLPTIDYRHDQNVKKFLF